MPKIALVFGHTFGLGFSIAQKLLDEGYNVVGVARSKSSVQAEGLLNIQADLSVKEDIERVIQEIRQNHFSFEVLVYATGVLAAHSLDDLNYDDAMRMYQLHILAPMHIESHLLDFVKQNNAYVINVTSSTLVRHLPQLAEYASSKAAFARFTKQLQKELEGSGARVMDLCPSGFASNILITLLGERIERDESAQINPDDIADLVCFILKLPPKMEVSKLFINRKL